MQRLGSPLPRTEYEMRARIARALDISERDLVYVAELMELKPEESRWRLAVEKVLRGAGLRLLVPDAHMERALRFVNENDMRGRIQLQHVQHGSQLRTPPPGTLATKLQLADPTHDSAVEALNVIAAVGDYVCVDGPGSSPNNHARSPIRGCARTAAGSPSRTTGLGCAPRITSSSAEQRPKSKRCRMI